MIISNYCSLWLQALAHVGGDLAKLVPGRVSTEVDARLAYDTHGIVRKVEMCKILSPVRFIFSVI